VIDAHQHFWDPARTEYPWLADQPAALRRRFGPEDLEPLLREHGVDGTVVVQARSSLDETRALLELAESTQFVLGVVGWIDLAGNVPVQLRGFDGPLVGVRHQVHDEPDPEWLLRNDVQRGLAAVGEAGLAYDLLVRTRELPAARETALRHPDTKFVLDHVAKRPREDAAWAAGVQDLATVPNIVCKLSGLFTECAPADTAERALAWFGPERCIYGSDWPVCLLACEYQDALSLVESAVSGLSASERAQVMGETAARVYGLAPVGAGA
jgi:L-fucono-1,5-lactonase